MFDGTHSYQEIGARLPGSPEALFTPVSLQSLRNPSRVSRKELREGDRICTGWTPRVPVKLYLGDQDRYVVPANTNSCATDLRRRGAEVTIHSTGAVDHNDTARTAYPQIVRGFARWS